jgi:TRAP-type C4-dicarboxylate transport system substrate-binding protein
VEFVSKINTATTKEENMRNRLISLVVSLFLILPVSSSPVMAAEFIYGSFLPPKHGAVRTLPPVFERLKKESNGELDWKIVSGGQLFGGKASLDGAGKHLADGAVIILSYFASQLPTAFTLIDLALYGENPLATLAASTEEFMLSCPQCQADYKKRNTIWLAGLGATHQKLLCAKPVTKLSDIKGLKIRTSGGLGRLAKAMGGVAVGMGSTAIYAGLQRGQLDCTIGTEGWLMSHRLIESVTHVYDYPLTVTHGQSTLTMNLDRWKSLSPKNKKLMLKYSAQLAAVVHINGYKVDAERAKTEGAKKNVRWVKPNQEFKDFMADYRTKEMAIAIKRAKKRGVKNPEKLVASHLANVAKWEKKLAGKTFTPESYAEMLWDEIYSKVDPEKL